MAGWWEGIKVHCENKKRGVKEEGVGRNNLRTTSAHPSTPRAAEYVSGAAWPVSAAAQQLSKEYGSVYTVHLGPRRVVVLSGYQAVKEALVDQGEEFSGRGDYPVFFNFTKGNGIAFSNGDRWKVLRRFSIQILRNFGMGKRSIEERILEEGSFLLAELRKTEGEPFDPTFVLSRSVSNIICSVLFGSRFDYDDERLLTVIRLINDNFQIMSSPWGELYNIFPSLLDWVPGPHQRIFQNFKRLRDLIAHSVHDHQASLDPRSPRDFIDCFLTKMAEEKDPLSHFHMDTLLMTTHNLLFGGTETVGTTLRHAFLALMKYPKVQARVQEEIDLVVGRTRLPTLEDRAAMPYTDAVIHEVQRFADIIPMNLPHRVIRDTAFSGFLIPKGTDIITLLNTVHYDPSQFLTPQEFNPEHFLDANQSFKKSPAFMPFSAGEGRKQSLSGPISTYIPHPNSTCQILSLLPSTHSQLWMYRDIHSSSQLCAYRAPSVPGRVAGAHGALSVPHRHPPELLAAAAGCARGHRPDPAQLRSRQFAAAFPAVPVPALTPQPFQIRL
ncbi:cytochrome P450 2F1 isoform X4 [Macaca fascicularis]|uniref:cytochrome P450 2F1 isoform X4 n=1 Tax=Macaca fascicularis TaxID=9541 RepID=UPI0032B03256